MVEEQSKRIEHEITSIVDSIDREYLRKMQANMHLCAAKCCESTASMDSVQSCIERCSLPLTRAQNYVQSELQYFQKRLQRCVMDCNDTVRDRMPPNPSNEEITKYTSEFEKCAKACVDKHVGLLPNIVKSIKAALSNGKVPDVSGRNDN